MDTHSLLDSAVTLVLKEIDFTLKAKTPVVKGEIENYDIFGFTEIKDNHIAD